MSTDFAMDKVAGSGNDEFYTPPFAVEPIVPYVRNGSRIWCPFDDERSYFAKRFTELGCDVICTHIATGGDFFSITVPECDYIISNPPYSKKTEVLKRLFEIGKPFAVLIGVVGLFESHARFGMFRDHDFEILYMNKRIAYLKDYADTEPALHPPFSSVYVCSKMLPRQIVFSEVDVTKKRRAS